MIRPLYKPVFSEDKPAITNSQNGPQQNITEQQPTNDNKPRSLSNASQNRPTESSIKGVVSQRVHQYSSLVTTPSRSPPHHSPLSPASKPNEPHNIAPISSPLPEKREPTIAKTSSPSSPVINSLSTSTAPGSPSSTTRPLPIPTTKRTSSGRNADASSSRNNTRNGNQMRSAPSYNAYTSSNNSNKKLVSPRQTPPPPAPKTLLSSTPAYYRTTGISRTSVPSKPVTYKYVSYIPPRPKHFSEPKKVDNATTSTSTPISNTSSSLSSPCLIPSSSSSTSSTSQHYHHYQGSPRSGSRHVHEIAQQFNGSHRNPVISSSLPTSPLLDNTNSNDRIPTPIPTAPRDIPQVSRKTAKASLKRSYNRQTPAHTHSVDIFFPLPNSPLMDRRRVSRKRPQRGYAQEGGKRKVADLYRSQSAHELRDIVCEQSTRQRATSAPPFPQQDYNKGLIRRPVSLKIPIKKTRPLASSVPNGSSHTFFKAIPLTTRNPSSFTLRDYRSPPSSFSPSSFSSSSPSPSSLVPPELQNEVSPPVSPRSPSEASSPSSSPPSASPPSASPRSTSSPPLDPAWTYYKAAPVPPPMPKRRQSSRNTLRLSQKRHDTPLYNTVQVLGTEMKQDFKRNKPYTLYVIQATFGIVSWTIYRRFSEFHTLQSSLQKAFPDIKFSKSLPSKKLLGTSVTAQLVFERRTLLETYLRQFIDMKEVCQCKELQAFIKDQHVDVQDITLPFVLSQGLDYSLKLLSSAFGRGMLREYATTRWEMESDDVLQSYLLQLVQALRFENISSPSRLPSFLITRGVNNPLLGNFLHWHLMVEKDSKYPIFTKVHEQFKAESLRSEQGLDVLKMLMGQNELMNFLSGATVMLTSTNKIRQKKIKKLKKMFNPDQFLNKLLNFPPLRFPLDPSILATGIVQDTAYLFKSNLAPMLLQFQTTTPDELFTIIFKKGDDLRQDQLITQMVALMDNLLKKEGLDLKLTPYRVLATSRDEGLVQHIPSVPFATALEEGNFDLQKYFVMHYPDPDGEFGFPDEMLDNFVRSSAGYCVITFLLGIGDRHLDNVLLTPSGKIFHIDFGYILDANPPMKFAPPMKLSKEMIDAMGGVTSKHYRKFIDLSVSAYNELRRHADLITNLFILMADSGIKDIPHTNDIIPKLQKKFRMDLSNEEASVFLQSMINESVSAVLPQMVESIHRWAQQRRN